MRLSVLLDCETLASGNMILFHNERLDSCIRTPLYTAIKAAAQNGWNLLTAIYLVMVGNLPNILRLSLLIHKIGIMVGAIGDMPAESSTKSLAHDEL